MDFEALNSGNFSLLSDTVKDWTSVIDSLKRLEKDAREDLKAKADKANWEGVNATVSREFIGKTAKEFSDAHTQATTIRNIIRDTRDELVKYREQLREAVDRGLKKDLVVGRTGNGGFTVSANVDIDLTTKGAKVPEFMQQEADNLRDEIQKILNGATESDTTAARVLREIATMTEQGFAGADYNNRDSAVGDMRKAEGAYAAKLAKEVTGEGGTARNYEALKKLEHIIDINSKDAGFSAAFYQDLGPQGSLDFYTKMSLDSTGLAGPEAASRTNLVHNIQNDMGPMLGLATDKGTPNYLGDAWTKSLMKAGHKEIDVSGIAGYGTKVYGYQALGSLIRDGEYDKEFLTAVGRDMAAMDKKNPDIWREGTPTNQDMAFNLDKTGGRGFNPITGLMEAMSNNPEASTAFFNEGVREDSNNDGLITKDDKTVSGQHGKPQGMVDYFLDKEPNADSYDLTYEKGAGSTPGQTALGNALEAAVTQRTPGDDDAPPVEHSKAMANVMERVVAKIGENPELIVIKDHDDWGPGPLGGLTGNFGNMAAEYMPDLQATAENGANQIKPFGHMAEFDKGQMAGFLGTIAQDPQAYGAITNAQQAYTTALVHDVFKHPSDHPDMGEAVANAVHPGGEIAGMMSEAKAQAMHDTKLHEDTEFNEGVADQAKWTNRIISAAGAKYIELLPVGGDVVTWIQEDVTAAAVKRAEMDTAGEGRREVQSQYGDAEKAAKEAAEQAVASGARGTDIDRDLITEYKGTASRTTGTAHSVGRDFVATAEPDKVK